ncbi:alpha/beta hydrolase [Cellvibrio polysaccharolyticus]|uniref:Alpha/beta hydrolase n=1 Tax=Cellvibrio polysaccharolyticus TaxID=2082724 RepID=A0A928YS23_9GAMM|nr:alpha/beta hydrolase-fold protein [Cellvibrio polysaccharolyticus]MBE8715961.1 alpha/beta hydrolase [Cellvibrio polysaccharolyticus]
MGSHNIIFFIKTGLLIFLLTSCQQISPVGEASVGEHIPLHHLPALNGDYFKFDSSEVGRPFHIYIRFPVGYSEQNKSYPVVYLLDGDSLFPILAANHLFLTYDEGLAEAIVVGISYGSFDASINKRGFDFTAPAPDAKPGQGGAPAFHKFLELELIPEIETRYRADPAKRILFGQSRGGFMVLYSAFTNPDFFWGRIASNPTFDPGRDLLFSSTPSASRSDLALVVTSGTRDYPPLREAALEWYEAWGEADEMPWALNFVTINNGTHAANSTDSYRAGMLWLFSRDK